MDKIKPFKKIVLWVRDNFQPKSHKLELGPTRLTSGLIVIEHKTDNGVDIIRINVDIPVHDATKVIHNAVIRANNTTGLVFIPSYLTYDNLITSNDDCHISLDLNFINGSLKILCPWNVYNSLYDAMVAELADGGIIEYTLS